MHSTATHDPRFKHVEANLNYLDHGGARHVVDARSAIAGEPLKIPTLLKSVLIRDARAEIDPPTLDRNGFQLVQHASELRDFSNEEVIRAQYYPETAALLQRVTGAQKVVIFDHAKRLDAPQSGDAVPPVRGVHCDQTFVSGPRRVRDHLPAEEAEMRLQGRCAIINVWRPIGAPVFTAPLALCDARSIAPSDIVPTDFVYPDKVGEVALFRANDAHRWFYFSEMRPEEAVLIKIFDSSTDGTARLSAHTAFDDPTSPKDAPARRSIEVRALVFW